MLNRARSLSFGAARRRILPFAGAALLVLASLLAQPAVAQQVAQYTFEDGPDGWVSFNGASAPVSSTAAFHGGTHSLLTTTNSSGQSSGPSIALTGLTPGATYSITGFVMLTSGEPAVSANFTVKSTDSGCSGGTCFTTVGQFQVPASDTGWAQIGGNYTVSATGSGLTLYAQLEGATTAQSFYLDDVTITEIGGPPGGPQDNSGITTNFEDGGLDGWSSRSGSSVLTNAPISGGPEGDTNALNVTNRAADFDGPQINVSNKMFVGSQYSISVWVMSPQGDTLRVSLQTTLTDPTTQAAATSFATVIGNTVIPAGQWVQLSIPRYSMSAAYDPGSAFLYVESASGAQDFSITDFELAFLPPLVIQQDIPSIYQTLAQYFPVGAEIDSSDLSGPHAQLLTKHFDSIVSGNDMKWQFTENPEGTFTFTTADSEVKFAQANNMLVRGHNLVWSNGSETPSWVFLEADGKTPLAASNPADAQLLTARIQNHIRNVVQHFGTAVYVWDVVNEPLDPGQSDCLQHGPFYQVLGRQYINIALQAARQYAPPGTQLFINDFSTTDSNRLQCLIKLVRYLRANQVPLDGVGHEMHNHVDAPSPFSMLTAIETLHLLFPHLHQQVTELDMSVYLSTDNTSNYGANGGTVPDSIIAEQGWLYKDYFDVFRALKGKLDAVTFWGIADDNTWLDAFPINRLDEPLPFDQLLQAKPAYWGIIDPTQLPGYGTTLALTAHAGPPQSETWTITATNPSEGTAYSTEISSLLLLQTKGRACRAIVVPPSKYPVSLGDVGPSGMGSASFTVKFEGCRSDARFVLWAPWSSNVYDTGTLLEKDLQP